jgi:hypothetical protein
MGYSRKFLGEPIAEQFMAIIAAQASEQPKALFRPRRML